MYYRPESSGIVSAMSANKEKNSSVFGKRFKQVREDAPNL